MSQEYRFLGCADHLIVIGELTAMGCEMDDCDAVVHCGPAGERGGRDEDGVWRQRTSSHYLPDGVGDGISWTSEDLEETVADFCDGMFQTDQTDRELDDELSLPRSVCELGRDGKPFIGKPFSRRQYIEVRFGVNVAETEQKAESKPEPKDNGEHKSRKRGRRGGRRHGKGKAHQVQPPVAKPEPQNGNGERRNERSNGRPSPRRHNGLVFVSGEHRGQRRYECRQGSRLFVWDRKIPTQPVEGKSYDCQEVTVIAKGRLLVLAVKPL